MLNCPVESLEFDGKTVSGEKGSVTLADIATSSMCGNNIPMEVSESNSAPTSPPPFMVGMVRSSWDKGNRSQSSFWTMWPWWTAERR